VVGQRAVIVSYVREGESIVRQNDTLFIVLGAFYLAIGMLLGIVMGIRQDFTFAPLHAHINLVGFAGHCVFGLVYKTWPNLKQGAMAAVQFGLYVVGAPLLMAGIALSIKANNIAVAIAGSILVLLGALLFLVITARGLLRSRMD
jgi:hypothetical protein